jgi:ABC-2 type transport system ATP-binding protein
METAEKLCDDILLLNKSHKVLSGSLRQIKESYGKNVISLRCKGGEEILNDKNLVSNIIEHSDEKEIFLAEDADSQMLLKKLIESGAAITKFEMVEPSLNDIFIDNVKDK